MGRLGKADQLLVGLADELDAEAEQAVEEQEGADELARLVPRLGPPEHPGENSEQDDAFQHRFIELAGMTRRPEYALAKLVIFLEPDRPRNRRWRAPQLLVDEVGNAPEEQAEGDAAGDVIVD